MTCILCASDGTHSLFERRKEGHLSSAAGQAGNPAFLGSVTGSTPGRGLGTSTTAQPRRSTVGTGGDGPQGEPDDASTVDTRTRGAISLRTRTRGRRRIGRQRRKTVRPASVPFPTTSVAVSPCTSSAVLLAFRVHLRPAGPGSAGPAHWEHPIHSLRRGCSAAAPVCHTNICVRFLPCTSAKLRTLRPVANSVKGHLKVTVPHSQPNFQKCRKATRKTVCFLLKLSVVTGPWRSSARADISEGDCRWCLSMWG